MASVASINFGVIVLERFKRRSTLEQFFKVLKIALMLLCVLLVFLIFKIIAFEYLNLDSAINKLENDVNASVQQINATGPQQKSKPNYKSIVKNSPFGDLQAKSTVTEIKEEVKPVSNVPLNLIGTFITKGEQPYAIIEDKKKSEQEVFLLKDKIFDTATLKAIYPNYVEIVRNGATEILKLDDSPDNAGTGGGGAAAGEVVNVDETELTQALDNLPLLLTQARAVPYFKDGKSVGLRLFAIKRGSLYEKIGLSNGDILKSINENSLADITQAVKLFEKLRDERSITLTLERNRADKVIRYEIQ